MSSRDSCSWHSALTTAAVLPVLPLLLLLLLIADADFLQNVSGGT